MTVTPIQPNPSKDYPETIDNRAVIQELETLQEKIQEGEVAEYVAPIDNRETLQKLELEKDELSAIIKSIGFGSILTGLTTFSIALLGLLLAWKPMVRLEKVSRLIKVMKLMLENFEDEGIEMLPLVKIPKAQPIDLFVRFPGREFLIFAIRSHGEAIAVYHQSKDALYLKRPKKGMNRWKPDPLTELSEQEFWLRRNYRNLFGGSAKATRRPMAKVLVVWGQTQLDEHEEQLYASVSDKKFLFIRREQGGAFYVIHQSQVIDFVRAYLAQRQSQEDKAA